MSTVGSPPWIAQTRGAMTRHERAVMTRQVLGAFVADVPSRLSFRFSRGDRLPERVDLDVTPPDSALVQDTIQLVTETHEPWLAGHCLRTWAFGRFIAQVDGLAIDDETLFLAAMLHDVALTDTYRVSPDETPAACLCFAAHGAHLAEQALVRLGADRAVATTVGDAIGWHLNAGVPQDAGPDAVALNAGAALDVIGLRAADVGRTAVAAVIREEPRDGFVDGFSAALRLEAHDRPDSRTGLLLRLGFAQAIRLNPLNRVS
jgi:hypothetical protein